MELHKTELTEQLALLPDPTNFNLAAAKDGGHYDLGLFVLGFEDRCYATAGLLAEAKVNFGSARYLTYVTNVDDNRANERQLTEYLGELAKDSAPMFGDDPELTTRLDQLLATLDGDQESPPRVLFDMSVASDRLIMRCLKSLLNANIDLTLLYSEAAVYHPTEGEWQQDPSEWKDDERLGLERGVGDLDYSIEYPGHSLEPLPEFLLLFPSFSHERSQAIINSVDPTLGTSEGRERIVWFLGEPHLDEDSWRLNALREINDLTEADRQHPTSTFDFKAVLRVLDSVYAEASGTHRVTLSPMGSKLQTLASSLFCYMHPDVRVVLARPREYNAARYSHGCKAMWRMHFGHTQQIRRTLDEVGTLTLES